MAGNVVIIGAALGAAWLLGRSKRVYQPQLPSSPQPTQKPSIGDADNSGVIKGNEAIGLGTRDVSGSITNEDMHPLPLEEGLAQIGDSAVYFTAKDVNASKTGIDMSNPQSRISADRWFFKWFWLPASKVKLSEITPYEWRMAFALLGGSVHRRMDREKRFGGYVLGLKLQQESQAIGGIIAKIGAMVPIVGQTFAQVVQSAVFNAAASATASEARAMGQAAGSYRVAVDPKNLDPPAAMILAPAYTGAGDAKVETKIMPWLEQQGLIFADMEINGYVPEEYIGTADFPWPKFVSQGLGHQHLYAINRRWFCSHQYGLFLPWICDEFFSRQLTTKQQVNLVARVYKAIATLSVMAFPDVGIRDPNRSNKADEITDPTSNYMGRPSNPWGYLYPVYYYNNPLFGDVLGSIFPPTDEDKPIVNNSGHLLTSWGCNHPPLRFNDPGDFTYVKRWPSPKTLEEKQRYEAEWLAEKINLGYRQAKRDEEIRKLATGTNLEYLRGLLQLAGVVRPEGGDAWYDHHFTFEEIKLMPDDMLEKLPRRVFLENIVTSANIGQLGAQQTTWNRLKMRAAMQAM